MGKFANGLSAIMRGRRLARRVQHPAGVGFVMRCGRCAKEVLRGDGATTEQQLEAVEAHKRECRA